MDAIELETFGGRHVLHGDDTGGGKQRRAADVLPVERADTVAKRRSRTCTQVTVDVESHIHVSRRCEDVHPMLKGLRVADWPDREAGRAGRSSLSAWMSAAIPGASSTWITPRPVIARPDQPVWCMGPCTSLALSTLT